MQNPEETRMMPRSMLGFLKKLPEGVLILKKCFGGFDWKEVDTVSGFEHDLARDAKRHEHEKIVKI